MPEYAITAEGGCVSPDTLEFIATAVDLQMRRDVAPIYDTSEPWTVSAVVATDGLVDVGSARKVLTFRKALNVPSALGFHGMHDGVEYAEALPPRFAGVVIDGTTVSHEVLETFADPGCDESWPMPDGSSVDFEIGDPVEGDAYDISVTLGAVTRVVRVSNFVTPAWFQVPGTETDRRYDFLNRLSAPFTMTAGGYYRVVDIGGNEDFVYADKASRMRVAEKLMNKTSRLSLRESAR